MALILSLHTSLAAWAIWKKQHYQFALSIYLALTLWSGFGAVHGLIKKLKDN